MRDETPLAPGDRVRVKEGADQHAGYSGRVVMLDGAIVRVKFFVSGRIYEVPYRDLYREAGFKESHAGSGLCENRALSG